MRIFIFVEGSELFTDCQKVKIRAAPKPIAFHSHPALQMNLRSLLVSKHFTGLEKLLVLSSHSYRTGAPQLTGAR